jgi:hypothetical protein
MSLYLGKDFNPGHDRGHISITQQPHIAITMASKTVTVYSCRRHRELFMNGLLARLFHRPGKIRYFKQRHGQHIDMAKEGDSLWQLPCNNIPSLLFNI